MSNPTKLNIAHFNDVYQVSEQPVLIDGKTEKIDVTKFATSLDCITSKWEKRSDGHKDGLIIFSGDLFSPSIESSTTRGGHMPAVVNALGIDVCVAGNHEFDFGYPHLRTLLKRTAFPWLLSNIIDTNTGHVPASLKSYHVIERAGLRIGFVGLVEKEWIATITGWPKHFEHQDMAKVGRELSAKLRGEHKCDLVIAVTHATIPNDIKLAKAVFALSPEAQKTKDIASEQGVDLILGGHDHIYWISKGVTKWEGYDVQTPQQDAKEDLGDVLIVKSGTDFQDISEVTVTLVDTPAGSIRKKVIQEITGRRHVTRESMPAQEHMKGILRKELDTINESWKEPICKTEVTLDVRSSFIRTEESPIANWITDCLRHAYDEALIKFGYQTTDGVISNSGSFRGDKVYEPGKLLLRDLITILPFPDPAVVAELDGNALWDAMETGLSGWPAMKGGFPAISGFRVEWDSRRPPLQRVIGIWLLAESSKVGPDGRPILVDKEEVLRSSTRKYVIMVSEYLSQGGDGYEAIKGKRLIIPVEGGQPKSALVRKFLLGAQYLNKQHLSERNTSLASSQMNRSAAWSVLSTLKDVMLNRGRSVETNAESGETGVTSAQLFSAAIAAAEHAEVGLLDGYERQRAREAAVDRADAPPNIISNLNSDVNSAAFAATGKDTGEASIAHAEEIAKKTLPSIHPVVDGRLKNIAKD